LNLNKVNKPILKKKLDSDYEIVRPGPFHRSTPGKNRNKKNIKWAFESYRRCNYHMYICFVVDFTRQCLTCVWESHDETEHKPIDHNHNIM